MIPTKLRQQRFYGWTALAGVMLVFFSQFGVIWYSYGVFLPSICEEFDWSRSALSGPYSAFMITVGLFGPLAGIAVSRFGARKNIIAANLIAALGLLGMSSIKEVWHVYLFYSVLLGVGQAFGAFIATTTIVNYWFTRRRPLAMSLLFAAGCVGGFVFPPLISWLISSVGWRWGWVCLAGTHLVLAVGLGGTLIRNKPEEIGQVPDGEATESPEEADSGSPVLRRVYQTAVDWKVRDALRTRALWLVLAFMMANIFAISILTAHQVAYVQDLGFSPMIAATALGLLAGTGIIGTLVCGTLVTRFEGRYLASVCLAGLAAGMIILINAKTLPFIYLYAIISGISTGGIPLLMTVLFGTYFGRADYARIMGWTAPIITLSGALSPLLAGFTRDISGSYLPAFWVAVAFLGVGSACALLARPPITPSQSQPTN